MNRRVQAIHGHTKRGSPALEAFQRMHGFRRTMPDWIYVPITANDKVIAIGTVRTIMDLRHHPRRLLPPVVTYSIVVRCPAYRLQFTVNLTRLVNHEIWEIHHRIV